MPLVINGFDLKGFDKEFEIEPKEQVEPCFVCNIIENIYFQMIFASAITIGYIFLFKKVKK